MKIRSRSALGAVSLYFLTSLPGWAQEYPAPITTVPEATVAVPPIDMSPQQFAAGSEAASAPIGASTADHTKFKALQGPFSSGPEVTQACLSCHTEASHQVMQSVHWTWTFRNEATDQLLGKAHEINAFCGNVASNEVRCTSCHVGYGWNDVRVDNPMGQDRVDCLACHDRSGQYAKQSNLAGHPPLKPVGEKAKTITGAKAWPVDLAKAAQSVSDPGRDNCGNCHFYGGGGDNVKHGDLSSALVDPTPHVDAHMSKDGANMVCADCHTSDAHVFAGSRYDTDVVPDDHPKPGEGHSEAACQSCHGDSPHAKTSVVGLKLNDHTDTVACQTCHIPTYAKGGVATKTLWDWSTAGRLKDGKPYSEEGYTQGNGKHLHTYMSTKGDFAWGEDVVPDYAWFNGVVEYTLPGTTIDPTAVVPINRVHGDPADPKARIFPFKIMKGAQAYDAGLNRLVYNHVYGPKSDTALWTNFDWTKSIPAAMDYVGAEYSGKFGFVKTTMHWPITHMVAPADEALRCNECHARETRLAGIAGVYMPATGPEPGKLAGLALLALTLLGVIIHGLIRVMGRGKQGGAHHG